MRITHRCSTVIPTHIQLCARWSCMNVCQWVLAFWRCCGGASAFCRAPELWQHFQIQQIQTHVQTIQQKNQTHLIRILVMSVSLFACIFYFWSILYRFCLFSFLCVHARVCFEATGLSRCFKTCTAALKEHNLRMHLLQLVGTSLNWFITPPAPR